MLFRVHIHTANPSMLFLLFVQRGDAEMENKLNRVIRACVELVANISIVSIHY